ncbi:ABC transporter, partial [Rhizobium leguminosarum bv. viciae USDA 2370]
MTTTSDAAGLADKRAVKRKFKSEMSMAFVLIGIALIFEVLGWIFVGT